MHIGVVIPAHNEALLITRCLGSVNVAVEQAQRRGHQASVYVVCDACDDDTGSMVLAAGHVPISSLRGTSGLCERTGLAKQFRMGPIVSRLPMRIQKSLSYG